MNKNTRTVGIYILLILLGIIFVSSLYRQNYREKDISYTEFLQKVESKQIEEVQIKETYALAIQKDNTRLKVNLPENDPEFYPTLKAQGVNIKVEQPEGSSWWFSLFSPILIPLLIIVILWIFVIRQAQSGSSQALAFGKSKAKMLVENKPKVTFDDVAGADEAKQELEEIVDFLKSPDKYQALGAKIPKGVLLVGPPGTGKTLIAKAVAGEASVPFFSISGSEFVEMFVGVGASRVRDLFDQAKKHAPCLIFIDEIDAVGRQRGAGMGGGHDEREQTLNQLLIEMDGFEDNHSTIVIAATNRPDILDAALLRPGRFDRQVIVDRPDVEGREKILQVHAKNKPLAKNVKVEVLAKRTPGFTGADLANLANEAALLAARENQKEIGMQHLEEALDRVIAGPEKKSKLITEDEKRITAYHEMGHTLIGVFMEHCDPIHKVTIIPRGMALGLTMSLPENRVSASRAYLNDQIAMLLGGRIAEELVFNEMTTGASNDIERATELARKMVTQYGMSDKIGPRTVGKKNEHVFMGRDFGEVRNYSDEVARDVDLEIARILDENYQRAKALLTDHQHALHEISKVLIEKETLDTEQINELVKQLEGQLPPSKPERTYAKWQSQVVIGPPDSEPLPEGVVPSAAAQSSVSTTAVKADDEKQPEKAEIKSEEKL
ncbi:MAG: cell division protein FtsH [Candidatus Melainabacteria bacterium HGW-Melainabacteria-1]|nr:MAG: cell division protein FtsH [Candidatus Melainabacteria bacterium HGW-Melainabacteria-1]